MWKFGVTLAAGMVVSLFAGSSASRARHNCSGGGTVTRDGAWIVPGACVEAGDKIFGNFSVSGGYRDGLGALVSIHRTYR